MQRENEIPSAAHLPRRFDKFGEERSVVVLGERIREIRALKLASGRRKLRTAGHLEQHIEKRTHHAQVQHVSIDEYAPPVAVVPRRGSRHDASAAPHDEEVVHRKSGRKRLAEDGDHDPDMTEALQSCPRKIR